MRGSCKGDLCILLGWRAGKSLPGRCRYILPLELQTRVLLTVKSVCTALVGKKGLRLLQA